LITFLTACGVPAAEWRSWIEAVNQVRRAARGRVITDHDPLLLGVHPAIHAVSEGMADVGSLNVLTPYVVREHDYKLRLQLRDGCGHQIMVLVGGSSVGKTRACIEAVRDALPGWPVVHPATAEELLTLLDDGVEAGTVLWLNETQRYLQPPHGRDLAIALQRVLSSPTRSTADRVVILGSMWLDPYWHTFTRQPQHREPDTHAEVRDLLMRPGVRITVAEDFSTATDDQRAELTRIAIQDPRLAMAVAAGGQQLRVTQTLAGGPLLIGHYTDLVGTAAHAVLTAAMDAHRIGCESPLPAALLAQAAPGYLTAEQRAAGPRWLTAALKTAAQQIHGVHALIPIRTDETIDEADSYVLHDFLAQHANNHRRREPIPASLWDAVVRCVGEPHDLFRIARNAEVRNFVNYAVPVYRRWADAGDRYAAIILALLLRTPPDADDGRAVRRQSEPLVTRLLQVQTTVLIDQDGPDAVLWMIEKIGQIAGVVRVPRAQDDVGDSDLGRRLAKLLVFR
jgi:hypothetical protein